MALRIIFMGTPQFAVPTLRALHAAGHEIVASYSQPPRPAGRRGLALVRSPVQLQAEALDIPVRIPATLKLADEQAEFAALEADVAVVVAYGMILPRVVLDAPRLGCFNGHASLLPRWRGAAPIQRAIMAGDGETGVMVMRMEAGLDTGPVALAVKTPILPTTTAQELHDRLSDLCADAMCLAMERLEAGELTLTPQADEGVTYATKIEKSETRVDWSKPSGEVARHINGLSPFPGAWCEMGSGDDAVRLKLLQAEAVSGDAAPGTALDDDLRIACGNGAVNILQLQKAGGRAVSAAEFLAGNALPAGTRLG